MSANVDELPAGWVSADLDHLVRIRDSERVPVNQKGREARRGSVPYYGATGQVGWIDVPLFNERLVLLGEDGAPFLDGTKPKAYIVDGPSWVNNHAHVLEAVHVNSRFLKHALDAVDYRQHVSGTTRLKLTQGAMRKIKLPLPPAGEQARIVAEIERRMSHIDAALAGLELAQRKTVRARASILRAATDGSLLDVAAETDVAAVCDATGTSYDVIPERPGWVRVRIDSIAKVGSGSTPKRGNPRFWEGGSIPWVTSGQVVDGVIRAPAELITDAALAETSVKLWPAGTLLVAMYGEGRTRGHCAELAIDATCNQACAAIALHPEFLDIQPYLKLVLQARYEENRVLGSGGVQENLNLGLIKSIAIDVPPKEVRDALASEVDRRLSLLDAAEAGVNRQMARCERLRRSTLAAAFTGQLVSQDPNDEPAEQLLEHIRAAKAVTDRQRRTRRAAKEPSR